MLEHCGANKQDLDTVAAVFIHHHVCLRLAPFLEVDPPQSKMPKFRTVGIKPLNERKCRGGNKKARIEKTRNMGHVKIEKSPYDSQPKWEIGSGIRQEKEKRKEPRDRGSGTIPVTSYFSNAQLLLLIAALTLVTSTLQSLARLVNVMGQKSVLVYFQYLLNVKKYGQYLSLLHQNFLSSEDGADYVPY